MFLAKTTKRVHMLVRSAGLAESMSRYLIRRIEESPTIVFQPHTEIVALEGSDHLESVRWRNSQTGQTEEHKICHVFIMTGADPNSRWFDGCVALDAKGFIKTGQDLSPENLSAHAGPLPVSRTCSKPVCWGFRGGRRAWRQHQACCVRGRRRINCDLIRSSSTPGIGTSVTHVGKLYCHLCTASVQQLDPPKFRPATTISLMEIFL